MKKFLYLLFATFVAVGLSACSPDDNEPNGSETEIPDTPEYPDDGNEPENQTTPIIPILRARH